MAVRCRCSACGHYYNLADGMIGKKVRCRACEEAFLVEPTPARRPEEEVVTVVPVEEDEGETRTSTAVRKRPVLDPDDAGPLPSAPKRRKFKKKKSAGLPVGLMIGGACAAVVLIGGIVAAVIVMNNQGPAVTSNTRPPVDGQAIPPQGGQANQQPVGQPSGQQPAASGFAITLSNPRVIREFPRVSFAMDYRFDGGRPLPGTNYVWIIDGPNETYTSEWHWSELSDQGTMQAKGFEIHKLEGPFEMYIEERGPGFFKKRASNSVKIEKDALPADNGIEMPRRPNFGGRGGPPQN